VTSLVRSGAKECPKNGHKIDIKVQAFMVHCNNQRISGFRWKRNGELFLFKFKLPKTKTITFSLRDIFVACRDISSLPEQVKQKSSKKQILETITFNFKNLLCLRKEQLGFLWAINICGLFEPYFSNIRRVQSRFNDACYSIT